MRSRTGNNGSASNLRTVLIVNHADSSPAGGRRRQDGSGRRRVSSRALVFGPESDDDEAFEQHGESDAMVAVPRARVLVGRNAVAVEQRLVRSFAVDFAADVAASAKASTSTSSIRESWKTIATGSLPSVDVRPSCLVFLVGSTPGGASSARQQHMLAACQEAFVLRHRSSRGLETVVSALTVSPCEAAASAGGSGHAHAGGGGEALDALASVRASSTATTKPANQRGRSASTSSRPGKVTSRSPSPVVSPASNSCDLHSCRRVPVGSLDVVTRAVQRAMQRADMSAHTRHGVAVVIQLQTVAEGTGVIATTTLCLLPETGNAAGAGHHGGAVETQGLKRALAVWALAGHPRPFAAGDTTASRSMSAMHDYSAVDGARAGDRHHRVALATSRRIARSSSRTARLLEELLFRTPPTAVVVAGLASSDSRDHYHALDTCLFLHEIAAPPADLRAEVTHAIRTALASDTSHVAGGGGGGGGELSRATLDNNTNRSRLARGAEPSYTSETSIDESRRAWRRQHEDDPRGRRERGDVSSIDEDDEMAEEEEEEGVTSTGIAAGGDIVGDDNSRFATAVSHAARSRASDIAAAYRTPFDDDQGLSPSSPSTHRVASSTAQPQQQQQQQQRRRQRRTEVPQDDTSADRVAFSRDGVTSNAHAESRQQHHHEAAASHSNAVTTATPSRGGVGDRHSDESAAAAAASSSSPISQQYATPFDVPYQRPRSVVTSSGAASDDDNHSADEGLHGDAPDQVSDEPGGSGAALSPALASPSRALKQRDPDASVDAGGDETTVLLSDFTVDASGRSAHHQPHLQDSSVQTSPPTEEVSAVPVGADSLDISSVPGGGAGGGTAAATPSSVDVSAAARRTTAASSTHNTMHDVNVPVTPSATTRGDDASSVSVSDARTPQPDDGASSNRHRSTRDDDDVVGDDVDGHVSVPAAVDALSPLPAAPVETVDASQRARQHQNFSPAGNTEESSEVVVGALQQQLAVAQHEIRSLQEELAAAKVPSATPPPTVDVTTDEHHATTASPPQHDGSSASALFASKSGADAPVAGAPSAILAAADDLAVQLHDTSRRVEQLEAALVDAERRAETAEAEADEHRQQAEAAARNAAAAEAEANQRRRAAATEAASAQSSVATQRDEALAEVEALRGRIDELELERVSLYRQRADEAQRLRRQNETLRTDVEAGAARATQAEDARAAAEDAASHLRQQLSAALALRHTDDDAAAMAMASPSPAAAARAGDDEQSPMSTDDELAALRSALAVERSRRRAADLKTWQLSAQVAELRRHLQDFAAHAAPVVGDIATALQDAMTPPQLAPSAADQEQDDLFGDCPPPAPPQWRSS